MITPRVSTTVDLRLITSQMCGQTFSKKLTALLRWDIWFMSIYQFNFNSAEFFQFRLVINSISIQLFFSSIQAGFQFNFNSADFFNSGWFSIGNTGVWTGPLNHPAQLGEAEKRPNCLFRKWNGLNFWIFDFILTIHNFGWREGLS